MSVAAYAPHALGDRTLPGISELVAAAKTGRLVLYIGAGVSVAPPSNGPIGSAVADRLRILAAEMLGCDATEVGEDTLEELASKVAAVGDEELSRLRSLAATAYDFTGLEPNYGHRAIAMLMREGLAKTITVNWDCAVEQAGLQMGVPIASITSVAQAQSITGELPLFKVHGCSRTPATIKITREDVDAPQIWAVAEVQAALTSGTIVFAGLATVGDYVSDPIEQTLKAWAGYSSAIRVAAPSMPKAWAEILGEHADGSHFQATSNEFFDNLLREIMVDCLMHVSARARNLAEIELWARPMATGSDDFRAAVQSIPAHVLFDWWRCGVTRTNAGKPFVTDVNGQNALMAVSLLAGSDGHVEVSGRGGRFSVHTPSQYIEIISRPGAHLTEIMPIALDRASRRWDDGAYDDGRTISFVVVGAVGRFPAIDAASDIAGSDEIADDISSEMCGPVRLISAEDAVLGRLSR